MPSPEDVVVFFADGRPPLTRRDLTHDNEGTMRREHYNIDRTAVTSWMTAAGVEQRRTRCAQVLPWGTYSRPSAGEDGAR